MNTHSHASPATLYTPIGERKYVNLSERNRLREELERLPRERRLFILVLIWTGARVSEVLSLTADAFQVDAGIVAMPTLKRRRPAIREIPLPPELLQELADTFDLRKRSCGDRDRRLWPMHRATAWRLISTAMNRVGVRGIRATPRGLRHAFGVTTVAAGVPLDLVSRLLGHASIKTTAIYTQASGPEQAALAERFWRFNG